MFRKFLTFLTVLIVIQPAAAAAKYSNKYQEYREMQATRFSGRYEICEGYVFIAPDPVRLNANEKKLVCGDPAVAAWQNIPVYQAKYNITNFLQERGYYFPEFKDTDGIIEIHVGEKSYAREIVVDSPKADIIKMWRKRKVKNKPLTPSLLNELERWVRGQLGNKGYPCADISATADATTGIVTIHIEPNGLRNFPEIDEKSLDVLKPGVLRRFDAFETGKKFNQRLLTLTSIRTEINGIVQSTYFVNDCEPDNITVTQNATAGKPRLVIAGVGVDTEEYVKGKFTWKHTRLTDLGTSLRFDVRASYRRQEFLARSAIYFLEKPSRWHLVPVVRFLRRDERQYNYISVDAALFPTVTYDNQHFRITVGFGPDLNFTKTYRGPNLGVSRFFSGEITFDMKSHDFEYFDFDPREGYRLQFIADLNHHGVLSEVTAQKLGLKGDWLYNVAGFDPPLLVLGFRGAAFTTITDRSSPHFTKLPPDFLYYLGGSMDLRGFHREQLPITYRTALTKAFLSFEARLVEVLPLWLQPLAFIDVGALSPSSLNLDLPVYWSPGFGVRVGSPIGIFRATLAHGFMIGNNNPANNAAKHWQFFFSFGEEF